MSWNHRVVEEKGNFTIREVYYENNGIIGWTGAVPAYGDTIEELRQELNYMLSALDDPVLYEYDNKLNDSPK